MVQGITGEWNDIIIKFGIHKFGDDFHTLTQRFED